MAAFHSIHRRRMLRLLGGGAALGSVALLAACGTGGTAATAASGSATAVGSASVSSASATSASGAAATTTSAAQVSAPTVSASASAASSSPAPATAASLAVKEVTFMRPSSGPDEDKAYLAMLSGWAKIHPETKASFISVSNTDYETKLLTEVAGGVVRDVIGLPPGDLTVFTGKKAIIPLDPYIARSTALDQSDFFPAHWSDGQVGGKQMGVPPDGSPLVVAYNVDLFKSAAVAEPTAAWTWDECLKIAQQLTKSSGGRVSQFGCVFSGGGGNLLSFLFANDANVIDAAANKATIDSPNAIQALTYLGDLNNKYHVNPKPSEQSEFGSNIFLSGKVGMVIANRGGLGTAYRAAPFKIAAVPLPIAPGSGHSGSQITPLQMAIETPNKQPDNAWALLEYLASATSQIDRFTQYGGYPSRRSVANDPRFINSVVPSWVGTAVNTVFAKVADAKGTGFLPHHPNWGQINDALNKQLDYLWTGERPADVVAKAAQAAITPLMAVVGQ